jgi:hypothetical protein
MSDTKITLEYIGPPGVGFLDPDDRDKATQLVPGRRYPLSVEQAEENLKPNNTGHWKLPEPPKAKAAVKE